MALLLLLPLLSFVGSLATEQHSARCQGDVPHLKLAALEEALHVDSSGDHVQMLQIRASVTEAKRRASAAKLEEKSMKQFKSIVDKAKGDPETQVVGLLIVTAIVISLAAFSLYHAYSTEEAVDNGESLGDPSNPRFATLDVPKFILMGSVVLSGILVGYEVEEAEFVPSAVGGTFVPFMMPGFSLLAGIFGSSVSRNSLGRVVCYTLGSNACSFLLSAVLYSGGRQLIPAPSAWFLWCLLSWRLLISPIFYLAGRLRIPLVMMFGFLHCACFFLFYSTYPDRRKLDSNYIKQQLCFTYAQFLFHTRFFAIGLLRSPRRWCETLIDFHKCYFSVCYVAFWLTLDVLCPTWLQIVTNVAPRSSMMNVKAFLSWTLEFALLLGFMLAVLNIIVSMSARLARKLPQLMSTMQGWGTRTLYCYVLHRLLLQVLTSLGSVSVVEAIPDQIRLPLLIVAGLGTNVLLCSGGVRYIFHWAMEPYWIVDLPSKSIASIFRQSSASEDRPSQNM